MWRYSQMNAHFRFLCLLCMDAHCRSKKYLWLRLRDNYPIFLRQVAPVTIFTDWRKSAKTVQHLCHDVFIIYNMKNQAGSWGQNAKINQSLQTRSFDIRGDTSHGMHILGSCIFFAWMLTADKKSVKSSIFANCIA